MCRFFTILVICLLVRLSSFGQNEATVVWADDTTWYVNPSYDEVYHPNYKPEFTFPVFAGSSYQNFKIDWGDGVISSGYSLAVENKVSHLYTQPGVFDVKLMLYTGADVTGNPDNVFCKKVMNRGLDATFRLSPSGSRRCMEWGGDSVKLILTGHNNPPGTEYTILIGSDIEKLDDMKGKKLFTYQWIDNKRDSAWIVALQPTGTYGARVGLSLSWAREGVVLNSQPGQLDMFWAYKSPDLRDIYHFTDTVPHDEIPSNFLLCIPTKTPVLWLDSAKLAQYQYRTSSSPVVSPYYKSVNDRLFFNVEYFWTDTVPTDDTQWIPVTGQVEYVDTMESVSFKKAGFYKMRMEAYNQCSYDKNDPSKMLYMDSLWTDSVKNSPAKRYFQVFEQAEDKLVCRQDSACVGSGTNRLVIVDRNGLKKTDEFPEYKLTLTEVSKNEDYLLFSQKVNHYKDGRILTGDVLKTGCDSTEIILTVRDTGDYVVKLERKCEACGTITVNFDVYVGDVPTMLGRPGSNPIEDTLFARYNFEIDMDEDVYQRCDSFRYVLQPNLWSNRNFQMDSVYFFMQKGNTQRDTILNYASLFYDFDSVGNTLNTIKVKAHNYCGWGREVAANFYTRTRPKLELLRDSLVSNDSLCLDFNYDYYLSGLLPEKYSLQAKFSQKTYVNGALFGKDVLDVVEVVRDSFKVRHPVAGKTFEYFKIINQDMTRCTQTHKDSLYLIPAPDTLLYPDSVRYCGSLIELETERLFPSGHKEFAKATWSWNGGAETDEKFPKFNASPGGGEDKLSYLLSNSKGCYRQGEILFKPKEVPDLQLKGQDEYCLPDTIKDFGALTVNMSPGMSLFVYHSRLNEANLVCKPGNCKELPLTPFTNDTLTLIYVLKNPQVDTAFALGCRIEDSIKVVLRRPSLEILKSDTLFYPWDEYDFSAMRGHVDTNDVKAPYEWKTLAGNVLTGGPDIFNYKYTLSEDEKKEDELRFEFSALSVCGKKLTDTLVVVVAHGKLSGYADTICLEGDYPLSEKLEKAFVDESTLKWAICYPSDVAKQGTLSASTGASVAYTPYAGAGWSDSVRICVEAQTAGAPGHYSRDTIVLKINPAPKITVLADSLIAEDHEINIHKISTSFFKRENVVSYKIDQIITSNNGLWANDSVYLFAGDLASSTENRYAKVELLVNGLPGCAPIRQEFTLLDLCPADFDMHEPMDVCAGDEVFLDTVYYKIKGFDKYTAKRWTLRGVAPGGIFDDDSSHYTAPLTFGLRNLALNTSKSYTTYKGNVVSEALPVEKEMLLTVHSAPTLTLNHAADTLCRTQTRIVVERSWLSVSPSGYQDSLRFNGIPLIGNQAYWTGAGAGGRDSIVFTVSQGHCTKWAGQAVDTLFLYRLPKMISGNFNFPSAICEASRPPIDLTGVTIDGCAKNISWHSTGGSVTAGTPPLFVPDGGVKGGVSLTLHVQPPAGCPDDTLRKEFSVYQWPKLILTPDTVCNVVGLPVEIPVAEEFANFVTNVRTIDWFLKGNDVSIGTTNGTDPFHYMLTVDDSLAGAVVLVAKVWPHAPCAAEYFYDTVQIVLEGSPEVLLPAVSPALCQGADVNLSDLVEIYNASGVSWTKKAATPGTVSGTVYNSGEYWGNASFTLHVQGRSGCPQLTKDLSFAVSHSPLPQGNIGGLPCQADTMRFNVTVSPGVSGLYEWDFGDGSSKLQGTEAWHIYVTEGEYQVRLTGKYGSCERTANLVASVNKKPLAAFTPDPQVVVGKPVTFTSVSEPAGVDCKWYFENTFRLGTTCEYVFTGNSGNRKVLLEVTTDKGCQDTVSHNVLAVRKPVAAFELAVDSCRGVVDIINKSERAYAQVDWDFGNGTPHSSDWEPSQQVYTRFYDDSVYRVTMIVKNVAGNDTLSLPVKTVSKLKAKFDVMPASGQCNQMEKELHVQAVGKADSVKVWWGDGHVEIWGGDQGVKLRRHRYVNDTSVVKYFPLVMAVKNVCEEDISKPVAVPVAPLSVKARVILDTNYRNECFGEERGFLNKSFGFLPAGYRCEWTFENKGGIVTDNRAAVSHRFNIPGEYQVKLRVYDNCNEDTDSVFVKVYGNDSLDFVVENNLHCSGKEVGMKFVPKGASAFGDFRWEFQDGSVASGQQVSHAFAQSGTQVVKLSAIAEGCPALATKTVQVRKSPEPTIVKPLVTRGCQPFELEFEGRNADGGVADALWDFKDDAFSNKFTSTKRFEKEGLYQVSFRLTTREGCVDSVVVPIQVLPTPEVELALSKNQFCTETGDFTLTCLNVSPRKTDCSFEWWKEGEMVSLQNDSVRLSFKGIFGDIALKLKAVHRQSGCVAEKDTIVVSTRQVRPDLELDLQEVCLGTPVKVTDKSVYSDKSEIDMGDGHLSGESSFEYVYGATGEYTIRLKVQNTGGCEGSMEKIVKVHPVPQADFSWDFDRSITGLPTDLAVSDKPNGGIKFTNLSRLELLDGNELKYEWDFGDATPVVVEKSPGHLYPNNGSYTVTLVASSYAGCVDSVEQVVSIDAVKGLYLPTAFAPAMEDEGVSRFQPKGIGLHRYKIMVYDQWGTCVWMSDKLENGQPAEGWDGTFKGEPLPGGLYKWKVDALFEDGEVWGNKEGLGYVLLIR